MITRNIFILSLLIFFNITNAPNCSLALKFAQYYTLDKASFDHKSNDPQIKDGHLELRFVYSQSLQTDSIPFSIYLNECNRDSTIIKSSLIGKFYKNWDITYKEDRVMFPIINDKLMVVTLYSDGDVMIDEMVKENGKNKVKRTIYYSAFQFENRNKLLLPIISSYKRIEDSLFIAKLKKLQDKNRIKRIEKNINKVQEMYNDENEKTDEEVLEGQPKFNLK